MFNQALSKVNPNVLTTFRLILTPLAMVLLLRQTLLAFILALAVMITIEVTDLLDGYIARKYDKITDFGKIYDPMCDAIYHSLIFICFIKFGLPIWIAAIFVAREMAMPNVRIYCALRGYVLAARRSGKLKANFQMAFQFAYVLILIFISSGLTTTGFGQVAVFIWYHLTQVLLFIAMFLTVYSFVEYLYFVYQKFHISLSIVQPSR
jgi:CDP-diacylglycerol--glycerol-3-phosphate 3-phosphatidyltransferase